MNFQGIQDKVQDWVNRTDLATVIPTVINMVQLQLERKTNYKYMEKEYTWENTTNYNLVVPPDYKSMISCRVFDASLGRYFSLTKMKASSAWDLFPFPEQSKSRPSTCSIKDGWDNLLIRPTPDKPYYVVMEYWGRSIELSGANDVSWLSENAYDILIYGALLELKPYLGDDSNVAVWQAKYADAVGSLQISEKEELHLGSQQVAQPYGDIV